MPRRRSRRRPSWRARGQRPGHPHASACDEPPPLMVMISPAAGPPHDGRAAEIEARRPPCRCLERARSAQRRLQAAERCAAQGQRARAAERGASVRVLRPPATTAVEPEAAMAASRRTVTTTSAVDELKRRASSPPARRSRCAARSAARRSPAAHLHRMPIALAHHDACAGAGAQRLDAAEFVHLGDD